MKIRYGFVSNSSSSSFVLYGAYVSVKDLLKNNNLWKDVENGEEDDDDPVPEDYYDEIDKILKGTGLVYEYGPDSYETQKVCIGRTYPSMKDEETSGQFKKDIKEKIEKLVGKKVKCSHQEEAWQDG